MRDNDRIPVQEGGNSRVTAPARTLALPLVLLSLLLSGCSGSGSGSGSGGSGSGSGGGSGPAVQISGNWQLQVTPRSGPAPFTSLAGFIDEQGTGSSPFTTAGFQAQPGSCYTDATTVPMYGTTTGSGLNLVSFAVNNQVLTLNVQVDSTNSHFSGNYSIKGGCANGASGTVTGVEYSPVKGTYAGPITGSNPAATASLALTQYTQGNGDGTFLVSGTATFTGISCFSQGTLAAQNGAVLGDTIDLTFTTNDPGGAQVQMQGTFDTAASTLTFSSIQVNGGSCPGSLGTATLALQP